MARRPSAASASEEVRLAVRSDILSGRIAPGSPLRPSRIAEAHGASLTVAREALNRLSESGIVELRPNQGFRVPPLRLEHWAAVAETRVLIDNAALRASVEAGDVHWEG
ncbi:GntR family transcriptional regulator, partial [Dickeya oryzae]|uniref:GntR family transcriptional regulator n=1 Tax=Dickeya oryzae TaxID=1240404 RepID=UPI0020975CB6